MWGLENVHANRDCPNLPMVGTDMHSNESHGPEQWYALTNILTWTVTHQNFLSKETSHMVLFFYCWIRLVSRTRSDSVSSSPKRRYCLLLSTPFPFAWVPMQQDPWNDCFTSEVRVTYIHNNEAYVPEQRYAFDKYFDKTTDSTEYSFEGNVSHRDVFLFLLDSASV